MSMSMNMSNTSSSASGASSGTATKSSSNANSQESVQEYTIRVPKNGRKKYHLMRFNATLNVDFAKWTNVKMERENNQREFRGMDEEQPKFGAGSEFGRDAREEARRKKLGFAARKYKSEDQPWLLKAGGKNGKKFKGIREGGVSENASYYVFTHAADGAIEAFPLQEWYNFTPIQTYKALSAEEAEQEFGKRNRVLNFFSLMMRKRLRGDEDADGENGMGGIDGDDIKLNGSGKSNKSKSKDKELKITEMDEWMESSGDDSDEDDDDDKEKEDKEEKANKNKKTQKKKKIRDTDAEAFEDSDDGDDEGRELDYISSSSESDDDIEKQLQGVAEEKALRKLLTSDEDSEDEENKSNKSNSSDDEKDKDKDGEGNDKKGKDKDDKDGKDKEDGDSKAKNKQNKKKASQLKKKDFNKNKNKKDKKDSSSSLSSDSDSDNENSKKKKDNSSNNNSRSSSPITDNKRKLDGTSNTSPISAKKQKLDMPAASLPTYLMSSSDSGITEDAVRRYLMRKPMTTTELLQKFKTKKTGLNSEQLVNIMTQILKKINPVKQTIKGKMYLSIKQ